VKTAALYARTSTEGQKIGLQLGDLRHVASMRGWKTVEYIDRGVSGATSNRPEFNRMMKAVRQGDHQIVAVWRFDRFARSVAHLITALDEFNTLGVEFYSYCETLDTSTPIGRAMFTVIAAMAEFERSLLRQRIQAGIERAKAKGVKIGRPRRYVNVERAREMLAAGKSQRKVAMALKVPRGTLRRALEREED
jgi:DNA invertase Pin-like site-specific DNA recombinase